MANIRLMQGKTVLVRADLNVPIKDGKIRDATRITLSAPTIRFLIDQGAKVGLSKRG